MKKEFGESYYHTRMGSTKITTKVASISMKQYCTITISKPIIWSANNRNMHSKNLFQILSILLDMPVVGENVLSTCYNPFY